MKSNNSTTRFSTRVDDYIKYRPSYPDEVLLFLEEKYKISVKNIVADIGAGTGISSQLFLEKGYIVKAVEPNAEMRNAAVQKLKYFDKFNITSGTAENTLLPDASIDIIVVAQAFHWFNTISVREEFKRILKPEGLVVLIWNERLTTSNFEQEYDNLINKFAIDYVQIAHRNIDFERIKHFYEPNHCELKIIDNYQDFDFEGLKGRLMSSSYIPQSGDKNFDEMITALKQLFEQYEQDNCIRISYDTKVYIGCLDN